MSSIVEARRLPENVDDLFDSPEERLLKFAFRARKAQLELGLGWPW